MNRIQPYLSGSVPKQLIQLALPMLVAMSFQTLYALANLFFVGKLGSQAVAALSISINAFFLVLTIAQSIGIGALSRISQLWGKKEFNLAHEYFTTTIWVTLVFGLISWAIAYFCTPQFISFFTQDSTTLGLGIDYFRIYSATFLLQLFLTVIGFAFRGSGDFKTPMTIMLISVLLNIALDPLLIYGLLGFPKLGVRGAAIASVFSQTVSSLALIIAILSKRFNLKLSENLRPNLAHALEMLKIGVPSGLQYLVLSAVIMLTYRWARPLGPDVAAAIGVGFRLLHTSYLPMVSLALATATLVGQNWGAQIIPRVHQVFRWGMIYANGWSLLITSLFIWQPHFFLTIFTSDPEVLQLGIKYLRSFGYSNLLVASIFVATATFQGLGQTITPLLGATAKLIGCGLIYLAYSDSQNLLLIYTAPLIGILLEFIWDLYYVGQALWKPKPTSSSPTI